MRCERRTRAAWGGVRSKLLAVIGTIVLTAPPMPLAASTPFDDIEAAAAERAAFGLDSDPLGWRPYLGQLGISGHLLGAFR